MLSGRLTRLLVGLCIAFFFFYIRMALLMAAPQVAVRHPLLPTPRLRSEMEHLRLVQVNDNRGRILYRNGMPWSKEAKGSGIHRGGTGSQNNPVIGKIGLPDVWPSRTRLAPEQGRSGLEYTFDRVLQTGTPAYLGTFQKVWNGDWNRRVFWFPGKSGVSIRTTIDSAWQKSVDSSLTLHGVKTGAVVILDIPSRQVLAMASRTEKLGGDSNALPKNQAVTAEIPGSVFKIVTAATALDSYRYSPTDVFYCSGLLQKPGIVLHCWRPHGKENLLQAFAGSCNTAFAVLGMEEGERSLEVVSNRLGLSGTGLQQVDGRQVLSDAEQGRVFKTGVLYTPGMLAHTAIGQQDVRISPLQAANLAATVATGGWYKDAQLVLNETRDGRVARKFSVHRVQRAISPATGVLLKQAMHMTVHDAAGTAQDLASAQPDSAVKTGTAQLSSAGAGKASKPVNSWLVGFAPYKNPQVAFAVFVGEEEEKLAHRQTHAIAKDLLSTYMQFRSGPHIG